MANIEVNDQPMVVRSNLYDFLLFWRRQCKGTATHRSPLPMLIWIDALSINQTVMNEKAREVRRMDKVYSSAAHVLVWLGKDFSLNPLPKGFWEHGPSNTNRNVELVLVLYQQPYFSRA